MSRSVPKEEEGVSSLVQDSLIFLKSKHFLNVSLQYYSVIFNSVTEDKKNKQDG